MGTRYDYEIKNGAVKPHIVTHRIMKSGAIEKSQIERPIVPLLPFGSEYRRDTK
jgi:hypothetical protein